jgi:hypothetical protein
MSELVNRKPSTSFSTTMTVTVPMTTATTGDVERVGAQGTPAIYLF